ncbi:uncharacterized protein [Symphalangus syndactylus]|uniref:uncharacterized protein n=1 Tax=Symphalangus syndactylus TaxID=9590 RepID=UPI0030040C23
MFKPNPRMQLLGVGDNLTKAFFMSLIGDRVSLCCPVCSQTLGSNQSSCLSLPRFLFLTKGGLAHKVCLSSGRTWTRVNPCQPPPLAQNPAKAPPSHSHSVSCHLVMKVPASPATVIVSFLRPPKPCRTFLHPVPISITLGTFVQLDSHCLFQCNVCGSFQHSQTLFIVSSWRHMHHQPNDVPFSKYNVCFTYIGHSLSLMWGQENEGVGGRFLEISESSLQ